MPKRAKELSAVEVRRLPVGFHPVGGVAGLALVVRDTGAKSWIMRVKVGDKRRDIGLGAYPEVSLARAREKAAEAREKIQGGTDPVLERRAARDALKAASARSRTFEQCTEAFLARKFAEFKNEKHKSQWQNTLETYAGPIIGKLSVEDITLGHITRILEPIWETKTETATRLRQRIEAVLAYAITSGYRSGANVAAWKGNLDSILAKPQKLKKIEHHKAVPVDEIAGVWSRLNGQDGMGAAALQFVILTACRSGEVRGARWEEVNWDAKTWTVPAERMKAGKEHVVPLSPAAIKLLKSLPQDRELIFPAPRGGMLSDMTLGAVLKRMGVDATVHGMRSTFRDWAAEKSAFPREVCEQALAHTLGAVEKAYRRSDLLEKRRRLMADWQRFLETARPSGKVVKIRA
jgi:integrase